MKGSHEGSNTSTYGFIDFFFFFLLLLARRLPVIPICHAASSCGILDSSTSMLVSKVDDRKARKSNVEMKADATSANHYTPLHVTRYCRRHEGRVSVFLVPTIHMLCGLHTY